MRVRSPQFSILVSLVARPLAVDLQGESDFLGTPGEKRREARAKVSEGRGQP